MVIFSEVDSAKKTLAAYEKLEVHPKYSIYTTFKLNKKKLSDPKGNTGDSKNKHNNTPGKGEEIL